MQKLISSGLDFVIKGKGILLTAKPRPVFVREATGLVRQIGLLENFAINYGSVPITTTIAIYLSWVLWQFPAADIGMSYLLAVIVTIGQTMTYVFFAACMPRSGGEYVYQSRVLHPALGFTSNAILWYGSSGMLVANFGLLFTQWLSGNLAVIGFFSNAPQLTSVGTSMTSPLSTFIIGAIVIVATGLIAIASTKYMIKTQAVAMVISVIAMIMGLGVLLSTNQQQFINEFNTWMSPYAGTSDVYHHLISVAQSGGFVVPPIAIGATVSALGIHFLWSSYFQWSSYNGGEFKGASSIKRQTISMLGAQLFVGVVCAMIAYALVGVAGRDFLASTFYLFNNNPSALPLPVSPSPALFMILAANGNVLVAVIMTIAFLATLVQLLLVTYLMTSRCAFAWAFDRVAPTWLADVNEKWGTPTKSILLVLGLGVIYMIAYSWAPPWFYILVWTATYFPQIIITFLFTGVAAVVYSTSKKWKASYDSSPAKSYQIAGIPLMAIMGVFSVITMLVFAGIYLTNSSYGVTLSFGIPYSIVIIAVPIIYFYVVRAYRKKQGIDIDLAFKELPPE